MSFSDFSSSPHLTDEGRKLLAAFSSPFSQNKRTFTMTFAPGSEIVPELLLPFHVRGVEKIFGTYLYQVEALSPSVFLKPGKFLGQPVQLAFRLADGSERIVTGVVTAFGQLAADHGGTKLARYTLHIEPCLAVLGRSFNACIRQDMTVGDILLDVLNHHIHNNPILQRAFQVKLNIAETLPTISYGTQLESDLHYLERLMAQYGLFYYFTFHSDNGHPVHTMVITDDYFHVQPGVHPIMRFSSTHAGESTISEWSGIHGIQTGLVTLDSYNYQYASVDNAFAYTRIDQGPTGNQLTSTLHDFDPQTHYYARGGDKLKRHAKHRQEANDYQTHRFTGLTADASLSLFESFEILHHPAHDQEDPKKRHFVVVSMVSEARNNLPQEAETLVAKLLRAPSIIPAALEPWFGNGQRLLDDPQQQPYGNVITCVRRDTPIREQYAHTDYAKPMAPGLVTATVIGPEGSADEVFTDEYGRVQVEFHFEKSLDNRATGSASKTRTRCWVRVLCIAAGQCWGSTFTPRIGQEVGILYINNDLDRLLCIGVLPNGLHRKSRFWNLDGLPNNRMQSGFKSKENQSSGYNQWVIDDTTQQLSMSWMTTHARTQFSQGWLGTPRDEGKSEPRGEGFELTTQAAGAIRTGGPLLLTTESMFDGPQLTRAELTQALSAALELAERTGQLAAYLGADNPDMSPGSTGHQRHLKEAIDNLERGYNNDPQGKTGQGSQPGGQKIMAFSSVDGTVIASQKSITMAAGTNIDQVAMRDFHQTTGRRWIHNVQESASLFVHGSDPNVKYTFKMIAAKGDVKLEAQHGAIEATAQKDFTISSVNGEVVVQAPEEILLMAGGGYIRIGKNIEIHCPETLSQMAALYLVNTSMSLDPALPALPNSELIGKHSLRFAFEGADKLAEDMNLIGKKYQLFDGISTELASGVIAQDGRLDRTMLNEQKELRLIIGEDKWEKLEHSPPSSDSVVPMSEQSTEIGDEDKEGAESDPYIQQLNAEVNNQAQQENSEFLSEEEISQFLEKIKSKE